ncbi:MAG: hypothetical protein ACTSUI_07260, partial [Promethearchaeota archaeon]
FKDAIIIMEHENAMNSKDYNDFFDFFLKTLENRKQIIQKLSDIVADYKPIPKNATYAFQIFEDRIDQSKMLENTVKTEKQISESILYIFSALDLLFQF